MRRSRFGHAVLLAAAIVQPMITAPVIAGRPAAMRVLKAGAARIDITPALADLPKPFDKVHDKLWTRAVVLDDGATRAVIVTLDVGMIADTVFADLTRRIAREADAPIENVVVAVTHTHNAVRLDPNPVGVIIPGSAKIATLSADAAVVAVRQAVANLRPARAGYAQGVANMVGRRDRQPRDIQPGAGQRGPGPAGAPEASEQGPLDRTLGVFKVEGVDGTPIAFLVNSTLQPTVAFAASHAISSDIAGVAAQAIEQRYGGKPVVLYTVGAAIGGSLYGSRPNGSIPPPEPFALADAVGTLFAEDVLATAADIRPSDTLSIAGAVRRITCPGKVTRPLNTPTSCSDAPGGKLPPCVFKDSDTAPVQLYTATLRLGDLTLVQADANVTGTVWQQVQRGAPANTLLVSLNYGPIHYVVEDATYPSNSYQATASTAKVGCVAQGFVDAATGMISATRPTAS